MNKYDFARMLREIASDIDKGTSQLDQWSIDLSHSMSPWMCDGFGFVLERFVQSREMKITFTVAT